ncbi:hypothetical protein AB8B12_24690, partial [Streptomyces sp. PGLac3x]
MVGAAAPVLFSGKAADRYGRRAVALAALALLAGAGLLPATELPPAGLLVSTLRVHAVPGSPRPPRRSGPAAARPAGGGG